MVTYNQILDVSKEIPHEVLDFHDSTYLNLLNKVLRFGKIKEQRAVLSNGTKPKTRSLFGISAEFDLRKGFPLLTTKKMFWKGIFHELIWFLKGETRVDYLHEHGVHIWDEWLWYGNDLGPYVYPHMWRDYPHHSSTRGEGVDQIANLLEDLTKLKTDPTHSCGRRLLLSAWHPSPYYKPHKAPPACHTMCQFDLTNDELSSCLYQRSADLFLGSPFNIASYSLLTHLIAKTLDLKVGTFIYMIGDAHIYENHISAVQEQFNNTIYKSPTIEIINKRDVLEEYRFEDVIIKDYYFTQLKNKPEIAV